ncbi:plasmid transfer protein TraA [Streptomyces sp. PT12]|uniref:plasmid transfer protein TraA n=1 Tax=Streptomyces sp. PT12 TaxID=1510197 RepID=UPI000DE5407D|nr:plasmid transfer protein TraA [Streptomyces sp. PT12]RBM05653.1 hypothetical protein DEH69_28155 [Streptomyces sp. PT12]
MSTNSSAGRPQVRRSTPKERDRKRREQVNRTTYRNKQKQNKREYHVHINKTVNAPGSGAGGDGGGGAQGEWSRKSPIGDADFLSAGHIRDFSERGRRSLREASIDLAYAAEALKQVLREVPAPQGQGLGVARVRAARVARQLKRAATAAQAASTHCARTWPAFLREFAPELNHYNGPRQQQPHRPPMNFGM